MLVQYSKAQCAQIWDSLIKPTLYEDIPYGDCNNAERFTSILAALLVGNMQCWVQHDPETQAITGFCITQFVHDAGYAESNLLIYHMHIFTGTAKRLLLSGVRTLSQYAKAHGCANVITLSKHPSMIDIAEKFGANTEWRILKFPVYKD